MPGLSGPYPSSATKGRRYPMSTYRSLNHYLLSALHDDLDLLIHIWSLPHYTSLVCPIKTEQEEAALDKSLQLAELRENRFTQNYHLSPHPTQSKVTNSISILYFHFQQITVNFSCTHFPKPSKQVLLLLTATYWEK